MGNILILHNMLPILGPRMWPEPHPKNPIALLKGSSTSNLRAKKSHKNSMVAWLLAIYWDAHPSSLSLVCNPCETYGLPGEWDFRVFPRFNSSVSASPNCASTENQCSTCDRSKGVLKPQASSKIAYPNSGSDHNEAPPGDVGFRRKFQGRQAPKSW